MIVNHDDYVLHETSCLSNSVTALQSGLDGANGANLHMLSIIMDSRKLSMVAFTSTVASVNPSTIFVSNQLTLLRDQPFCTDSLYHIYPECLHMFSVSSLTRTKQPTDERLRYGSILESGPLVCPVSTLDITTSCPGIESRTNPEPTVYTLSTLVQSILLTWYAKLNWNTTRILLIAMSLLGITLSMKSSDVHLTHKIVYVRFDTVIIRVLKGTLKSYGMTVSLFVRLVKMDLSILGSMVIDKVLVIICIHPR